MGGSVAVARQGASVPSTGMFAAQPCICSHYDAPKGYLTNSSQQGYRVDSDVLRYVILTPKTLFYRAQTVPSSMGHGKARQGLPTTARPEESQALNHPVKLNPLNQSIEGMPAFPSRAIHNCSPDFRHLRYRFLLAPLTLSHLRRARAPSSDLGLGTALTWLMSFSLFSCSPSLAVIFSARLALSRWFL